MKKTKEGNQPRLKLLAVFGRKIRLQRWLLDVEVQDEQYISFQQWEDQLR